jgi:hypothetical protein
MKFTQIETLGLRRKPEVMSKILVRLVNRIIPLPHTTAGGREVQGAWWRADPELVAVSVVDSPQEKPPVTEGGQWRAEVDPTPGTSRS